MGHACTVKSVDASLIVMSCSVKYQLSICKFKILITSECNNASTKTLYRKIRLRRLIKHTKLYAHTCYKHAWRNGRSLTSSFKLPIWVLYYRDPITACLYFNY